MAVSFILKKSEIRLKSENLHPCYIHPPPRCYFPYNTTLPSPCTTFYILHTPSLQVLLPYTTCYSSQCASFPILLTLHPLVLLSLYYIHYFLGYYFPYTTYTPSPCEVLPKLLTLLHQLLLFLYYLHSIPWYTPHTSYTHSPGAILHTQLNYTPPQMLLSESYLHFFPRCYFTYTTNTPSTGAVFSIVLTHASLPSPYYLCYLHRYIHNTDWVGNPARCILRGRPFSDPGSANGLPRRIQCVRFF